MAHYPKLIEYTNITGGTDFYVTGYTYQDNTFTIFDSSGNLFSVTIDSMTGLTINGNLTVTGTTSLQGLSATTISATTIGSSGDCVDNIYVSNIHSCSPLNINPLDEGNVYFGSTSGVTIDLTNNRVGIGTTTPTAKLSVSGQTNFSGETRYYSPSTLHYGYLTGIDQGSGYGTYLRLGNSSSGGHIDILSTNRTYLHQSIGFLKGVTNTNLFGLTTNESITINNGNGTGNTQTLIWAGNNANTNIFKIQGDSKIAINKSTALAALDISGDTLVSGNVGIGITSPTAKLHINNTTSGNTFLAEDDTNPDSSPFVIDASGNTGIGTTTPLAKLDVSSNGGRLRLTQNTAGNVFNGIDFVSYVGGITGSLISNQFTGELRLFTPSTYFPTFYSSGNEIMRISTSGNVGIGTTTPSQKLQVSGNISVSGSVIPNTQIISSSATVTPTYGNDLVAITGLSTNVTINNPTGTWPEGKDLTIRIKDNGVARTIAWDTKYRAIGVTLPNTTVASKTTYVGLIYNSIDDKFDVIGSTTEL